MTLQSLLGFTEPSELIYTNPKNPDEKPLILKVFRNDTKAYKQSFRDFRNKVFEATQIEDNLKEVEGVKTLTIELQNELNLSFLASLVDSWDGLTDAVTEDIIPFDRDLLKEVMLEDHALAIAINAFSEKQEGKSQKKPAKVL